MNETYSIDKWIKSSAGELETILGIKFNDRRLLLNAFTHSSYINEVAGDEFDSNERMNSWATRFLITLFLGICMNGSQI